MTEIMILGTFHLNSRNDIHNFSQYKELASQINEIEHLTTMLARFKPTKVAVEITSGEQQHLIEAYNRYLANGSYVLHEIHQIAFPVAKKAGLHRIEAVDWMDRGVAQVSCSDVFDYAKEHQPKLEQELQALETASIDLTQMDILTVYRLLNSSSEVEKTKAYYTNIARIGNDNYYGNGWLLWWYQRNLNIFTNLASLCREKEERIFLLIGHAHKGILETFIQDSKAFKLVDVNDYLI